MPKRTNGKQKANTNGNGTISELLKELWNSAVALRGAVEPSDYKRYVLPLIFLRFLSLRYEKRRAELEEYTRDPQNDLFTEDEATRADILEDEDEYKKVGALIVPEPARWETIVKNARADDVMIRLDSALELLETKYPKLKGMLPKVYAGSNLSRENLAQLINLFSKDIFKREHGGIDVIGRVYEYFIGEFASSEGKRGGEYFTPQSIVKLLVAMLEPTGGKVFDPCCGSGGMFVQSDKFTKHSGKLSFYGQESKDFTYRLCRLNLFIHGIDGDIKLGNSYFNDLHPTLTADYIIANPPFNDGSKGEHGWGSHLVKKDDQRLLKQNGDSVGLAAKNANFMWMMHFLYHLKEGGTAGYVMANGAMSTSTKEERAARIALIEGGFVDCIVQLPEKLFANTGIPCSLWFLSKNREGNAEFRQREDEILFIDSRRRGALMEGSRKQKEFTDEEIAEIAAIYQNFRKASGSYENIKGFCAVANLESVRVNDYVLTPGRYVGTEDIEDDGVPIEEKFQKLAQHLEDQFNESGKLEKAIRENLAMLKAAM
ncbi:MAG TPA: class I SAM-dependent DNA methyltransferase [Pyrinomonadaceae bacterium]|jgi:type I restriction enzyme M protein